MNRKKRLYCEKYVESVGFGNQKVWRGAPVARLKVLRSCSQEFVLKATIVSWVVLSFSLIC